MNDTSQPGAKVVIISDDVSLSKSIGSLAQSIGLQSVMYQSAESFLKDTHQGDDRGCIISGLRLPGISGLKLLSQLKARLIAFPVIILSNYPNTELTVQVMKQGAVSLLELPFQEGSLREAIHEAVSRNDAQRVQYRKRQIVRSRIERLNEKEGTVMQLMVDGHANKVMAKRLGVSVRTVESRRHEVFKKMEVASVAELVRDVVGTQSFKSCEL